VTTSTLHSGGMASFTTVGTGGFENVSSGGTLSAPAQVIATPQRIPGLVERTARNLPRPTSAVEAAKEARP
jgi:autotransporter passenger strand-loop-strand repeat protein